MPELSQNSTLQELSLHNCQMEVEQVGIEVARAFEANRLLPGAILTEGGQFFGLISRQRFLEQMSRPYGLELFLKRPLKTLHRFAGKEALVVPGTMAITEAASLALERSPDLLYEPLVVKLSNCYRLLDAQQLLVSQSKILKLTTQLLNQLYRDLETANQELERLACLDALTQLANRRRFDQYLDREWHRLAREGISLSLILCDVDYFKLYNDTYGHQAGDRCLQAVAKAICQAVKRPADLVARYGGEEFAVILPNTGATGAVQVAKIIQAEIQALEIAHPHSPCGFVRLSIGVATTVPFGNAGASHLILAADAALYAAKKQGRDRVVLSPSMS
ncbi:MAG: diguanylate cyclase [Desertifilum sp.]|nr:diguanylate cyclase [Desertifilum sp.]NES97736.1 diguanylate cyclase [Desertifilum sp. SIO1I2]